MLGQTTLVARREALTSAFLITTIIAGLAHAVNGFIRFF